MSRILGVGVGVVVVGALAFAAPAFAQGFYVSGNVGVNWQKDHDFDGPGGVDVDVESDPGYVLSVAVGHDYGALTSNINLRAEAELSYRNNEVDSVDVAGGSGGSDGEASATALMFNGFLDFKTNSRITPFVGLGVGVARVEFDDYSQGSTNVLDDEDTVFAWQAAVGAAYEVTNSFDVTAEYRYFNTTDADVDGEDVEYLTHSVMIGGRYRF